MVAMAGLTGCGMEGELAAMRERAAETHARLEADREVIERSLAALPEADPARAPIAAIATERATQAAAYAATVEQLDAAIASANGGDPSAALETGAGLVAPLLPPGLQAPALLAGALAAALWRAARLKKSAASIAEGLDKAMRDDDALREGVRRNAAVFRSVQTPTARRIVDEVTRRDASMLRLPV